MRFRAVLRILAPVVALLSLQMLLVSPANAARVGSSLSKGSYLHAGNWIDRTAYAGPVRLIMQRDGNLVLAFGVNGEKPCWSTGTAGRGGVQAVYQRDGNFVVVTSSGAVVWASNTAGGSGSTVDIDKLGNLWVGNKQITFGRCPKY